MVTGVTPPGHYTPTHIACVNHSRLASDRDVAFWVAAVDRQLREHVAPAWDGEPPGVAFYGHAERLPADQAAILGIVDDDGNAESAGYHTDLAGRVYGLVDVGQSRRPSVTLSHEALEMYGNARLDRRILGPKSRPYAVELSDLCQEDTYEIEAEILGERRLVPVSDFGLPKWWGIPADGSGRTTYLDRHRLDQFEIAPGGYQIAWDPDGQIIFLSQGAARMSRSAHSRTDRIRRGKFAVGV